METEIEQKTRPWKKITMKRIPLKNKLGDKELAVKFV